MPQLAHDMPAIAARFFDALTRGDVEAAIGSCTPDVRVWHSFDGIELDSTATSAALAWFFAALPERRYEVLSLDALADGFVQRHVLVGTLANGKPLRWPVCAVGRVRDGRIARLDEYMDSAPLNLFSMPLGPACDCA